MFHVLYTTVGVPVCLLNHRAEAVYYLDVGRKSVFFWSCDALLFQNDRRWCSEMPELWCFKSVRNTLWRKKIIPSRHKQNRMIMIGLVASMNYVHLRLMALSKAASQYYENSRASMYCCLSLEKLWGKMASVCNTSDSQCDAFHMEKDYGTKILEADCWLRLLLLLLSQLTCHLTNDFYWTAITFSSLQLIQLWNSCPLFFGCKFKCARAWTA